MLKDAEQAIQEDLEADGRGMGPVQHQAGDVEDDVGLDHLHRHPEVVNVAIS